MPASWKTRALLMIVATALYWTVIFAGTHMPGSKHPSMGHNDKFAHFGAFVGLGFLLCGCAACFRRPGLSVYAGVVGLAACYGILDELTQQLVKNRTADPLDWLTDVCGALVGTLIFAGGMWLFRSRERAHGTTA